MRRHLQKENALLKPDSWPRTLNLNQNSLDDWIEQKFDDQRALKSQIEEICFQQLDLTKKTAYKISFFLKRLQNLWENNKEDTNKKGEENQGPLDNEDSIFDKNQVIVTFFKCKLFQVVPFTDLVTHLNQTFPNMSQIHLKESLVSDPCFSAFGERLIRFKSLKKIKIQGGHLNQHSLQDLFKDATENDKIESLYIQGCHIKKETVENIFTLTSAVKTSLIHVCLEHTDLSNRNVQAINQFLDKNDQIRSFEIQADHVDDSCISKLIHSLQKSPQIQNIRLEGLKFEATVFQAFGNWIASVDLRKLNLSNSYLTDDNLKTLLTNLDQKEIQLLDISHNLLSNKSWQTLRDFLSTNETLENLNLASNKLEDDGIQICSSNIHTHARLETLDLSSNCLQNKGFCSIFKPIAQNKSGIRQIFLKNNKIGGGQIDTLFLSCSQKLNFVNLEQNQLTLQNLEQILFMTKTNVHLQHALVSEQKGFDDFDYLNLQIEKECHLNCQIHEFILKSQPKANSESNLVKNTIYQQFDVSKVTLEDNKYYNEGFLRKFIQHNHEDITVVKLNNVDFLRFQTNNLGDRSNEKILKFVKSFQLNNCTFDKKVLTAVVKCVTGMNNLEDLALNNCLGLVDLIPDLTQALNQIKKLKRVSFQSNQLKNFDFVANLMSQSQDVQSIDLSDNSINGKELIKIWNGFHLNIGVTEFKYSRFGCVFEIRAQQALEIDIFINQKIQEMSLANKVTKNEKSQEDQLAIHDFRIDHIEAIIKFLKNTPSIRILDLTNCNLKSDQVLKLFQDLTQNENIHSIILDQNEQINDSCAKDISQLLQERQNIKLLSLKNTLISIDGLQIILSEKFDFHLKHLYVSGLKLQIQNENSANWEFLVTQMQQNCGIVDLHISNEDLEESQTKLFDTAIADELQKNRLILENIVPKLMEQEDIARKNLIKKKLEKKNSRKLFKRQQTDRQHLKRINEESNENQNDLGVKKDLQNPTKIKSLMKSLTLDPAKMQIKHTRNVSKETLITHDNIEQTNNLIEEEQQEEKLDQDSQKQEIQLYPVYRKSGSVVFEKEQPPFQDVKSSELSNKTEEKEQSCSKSGDDESSSDGEISELSEQNMNFTQLKHGNFSIDFGGKKFESLAFLTKFIQQFPRIGQIDFGQNKMSTNELDDFNKLVKNNKHLVNVKGNIDWYNKRMLEQELEKNRGMLQLIKSDGNGQSKSIDNFLKENGTELELTHRNLQNVKFLSKVIQGQSNLKVINLSKNVLGPKGATQVAEMLQESPLLESLFLAGCGIRVEGLMIVCQQLNHGTNKFIKLLDIRENSIEDSFLKILFTLLFRCESLEQICYDLYQEENIKALEEFRENSAFKKLQRFNSILSVKVTSRQHIETEQEKEHLKDLQTQMTNFDKSHTQELHIKSWEKIVFPVYLWKTFIHAKHEAFRFKYDTEAILRIEKSLMPQVRIQLYLMAILYYIIMFALPPLFFDDDKKGYSVWLYVIYGAQTFCSALIEIRTVLKIQELAASKDLLHFNRWHFVEMFMGQTARLDTFLDFIILIIFLADTDKYGYFGYASLVFMIINLIFPIYTQFKLIKVDRNNSVQPLMEANNQMAFVRENMLLATVLDSFCVNNSIPIFSKQFVFGKLMGIITFFCQDLPQFTIHLLFKIVILNKYQKKLSKDPLLLFSIVVSFFALIISLFNSIMFTNNEFDPLLLEKELLQRQYKSLKQSMVRIHDERAQKKIRVQQNMSKLRQVLGVNQVSQAFASKLTMQKSAESSITRRLKAGRQSFGAKASLQIPSPPTKNQEQSSRQNVFANFKASIRRSVDLDKNRVTPRGEASPQSTQRSQ